MIWPWPTFCYSLLKVHLHIRGFSVFLDIERLRAGKFDDSLMNNVRNARNFVLVLTAGSLDRCVGDDQHKDWIHRVGPVKAHTRPDTPRF